MNGALKHGSGWPGHLGQEDALRHSRATHRRVSMTLRSTLAKGGFAAAVAAMPRPGAVAAPLSAPARPAYDDGQPAPYYDPCQSDRTNREVAGGVLGAIGG